MSTSIARGGFGAGERRLPERLAVAANDQADAAPRTDIVVDARHGLEAAESARQIVDDLGAAVQGQALGNCLPPNRSGFDSRFRSCAQAEELQPRRQFLVQGEEGRVGDRFRLQVAEVDDLSPRQVDLRHLSERAGARSPRRRWSTRAAAASDIERTAQREPPASVTQRDRLGGSRSAA